MWHREPSVISNDGAAASEEPGPIGATMLAFGIPSADVPAPNILSDRHLARIRGGLLHAATASVPWAVLHARTFDNDVLSCCRCGGRLRVRAVIVDPAVARRILAFLAEPAISCSSQAHAPPVAGGIAAE